MSELEIINNHIHDRLKSIQFLLDLSAEVSLPQSKIKKLGHEVLALSGLLEEFEALVGRQRDQLKELKVLEKMFQRDAEEIQYLRDNMPTHMPRSKSTLSGGEAALKQPEAVERLPPQTGNHKAINKTFIVEMEVLTMAEFDSIPQYMKGRVSYDQLNAVVGSVNTAVLAKYKIVHQPLKTLNDRSRKLLRRFKDQETKDTKGQYFFVEDDIREFTQMKVDKRFQGILNMLRHCQRLRELRGGGLTRYILL